MTEVREKIGRIIEEATPFEGNSREREGATDRQQIYAGEADLAETVAAAWDALESYNSPCRFFRHGGLVTVAYDDTGQPRLDPLSDHGLRLVLSRAADWFKVSKQNGNYPAKPPLDVARAMLTDLHRLPALDRIVRSPVVNRKGDLVTNEGYDSDSRVFYAPCGLDVPDVATNPTAAELQEAVDLLVEDLFGDFPFVGDAERAHAIALLLLPFVRDVIDGSTPIHLIEKPMPGTGASLLADVVAIVATGRRAGVMAEGGNDDEWRKRITSTLMTSPTLVLIDNIKRKLDSGSFSGALTAGTWTDRILGVSENISLPVRCAWVVTGNNPSVSTEIARRSISIRLDPQVETPWDRPPEEFRHRDLRRWASENRGRLIWAALTMVRAWFVAGKPPAGLSLGGFDEWSDVVGGIIEVARIQGFLANRNRFYDRADAERDQWDQFIRVWWDKFPNEPVGVGQLLKVITEQEVPLDLGKGTEHSQKIRLGVKLKEIEHRRFTVDDLELRPVLNDRKKSRANQWCLDECCE